MQCCSLIMKNKLICLLTLVVAKVRRPGHGFFTSPTVRVFKNLTHQTILPKSRPFHYKILVTKNRNLCRKEFL